MSQIAWKTQCTVAVESLSSSPPLLLQSLPMRFSICLGATAFATCLNIRRERRSAIHSRPSHCHNPPSSAFTKSTSCFANSANLRAIARFIKLAP